ncbi:hypothetical protein ES703_68422 [subsurface metagenome]
MKKMMKYHGEHINRTNWIPICTGLGIAWLLSLIWQGYSPVTLVLGIVFLVASIVGHIYIYSASRKMEV